MECDICGNKEASFIVQIEGAKMGACKACAYHGKILLSLEEDAPRKEFREERAMPIGMRLEEDLIEGYGKKVRRAREARGQKIEELAMKINEKASYLDNIENEGTRPPLEIAKKIERELKIRLLEKVDANAGAEVAASGKYKKKDLSLLDMLEMQNKKGK